MNSSPTGEGEHHPGQPQRAHQDQPDMDRHGRRHDDSPARAREVQEEQFGGLKFGAAFFGWLTAVGTTVLLVALIVGAGGVVGFATDTDASQALDQVSDSAQQAGIISSIVLLLILLISYLAGGYVAGRMARFNGAKQGIAVWLWSLLVTIVLAVIGAVAGSRFDVLSRLDGLPQIPISTDDVTVAGIIAAAAVILVTLGGAVLGGVAGMRYHRRIDRATQP